MIEVTLDDREVRQMFSRLQKRLGDLTPVMEDLGELIVERTKQRFARSTDPAGRPWAPNKPATLARKKGTKPLIGETKSLMGTLYYRADRASVTVGSPMEYAAIHQFGGQAGRSKKATIPPRPFLPVTESGQWLGTDDRQAVLDILRDYLAANPHG